VPGGTKGKDAETPIYKVDAGLLDELRNHEKQAAEELGQWGEKRPLSGEGVEPLTSITGHVRRCQRRPARKSRSLGVEVAAPPSSFSAGPRRAARPGRPRHAVAHAAAASRVGARRRERGAARGREWIPAFRAPARCRRGRGAVRGPARRLV